MLISTLDIRRDQERAARDPQDGKTQHSAYEVKMGTGFPMRNRNTSLIQDEMGRSEGCPHSSINFLYYGSKRAQRKRPEVEERETG